ncbi:hypothetical protein MA3A0930R_0846 [Mycobacteroides abscessus 3A-0930-R]|nr:hypothetical protein MA3A0930R_0846 [Mycobacteroides abscessus 3A-0930-R]
MQDGADGLDSELLAISVDESDYFRCWRSSSAPKKLAARFRISLARLSSRFSCSSSLTLFDSVVHTPAPNPRRCRTDEPRTAPIPPRSRAGELPATRCPGRYPAQPLTSEPSVPLRPSPRGCTGASWAYLATVPSAYLHPRFQGQEPPGFPGRFNAESRRRLVRGSAGADGAQYVGPGARPPGLRR